MNPLTLYRSLPYLIIIALSAALAWTTHLYLSKRDQLAALTATVQALGVAAEKAVEEKKVEYANNLQTVKEDHEALTSTIRATAVANYVRTHPHSVRVCDNNPPSGTLPPTSPGKPLDDDTLTEPVLDGESVGESAGGIDSGTIQNCAEDALALDSWQMWAKLNHFPVEP